MNLATILRKLKPTEQAPELRGLDLFRAVMNRLDRTEFDTSKEFSTSNTDGMILDISLRKHAEGYSALISFPTVNANYIPADIAISFVAKSVDGNFTSAPGTLNDYLRGTVGNLPAGRYRIEVLRPEQAMW